MVSPVPKPLSRPRSFFAFIGVGVGWVALQALLVLLKPTSGTGIGEVLYTWVYVKLAFLVQVVPTWLAGILPSTNSWIVGLLLLGGFAIAAVGAVSAGLWVVFSSRRKP